MKRDFASLGAKHDPRRLNKVSKVEQLIEKAHPFTGQFVNAEEQLHFARAVFDMRERYLTHRTRSANAAHESRLYFQIVFFRGFKFRDGLYAGMCALSACRVGFDAFCTQFREFLQTNIFKS